jgi:anti-sigma factor RsiW
MRDDHIIDLLDGAPHAGLSEDERSRVEAHVVACPACMRAYEATRFASDLLEARAREVIEPSPFFETRVMAALRERQAASEGNVLARMWREAGALVSAMAMIVLLLAGVAYFTYSRNTQTVSPELAAGEALYSPEWDLLEQADSARGDMSDDQVLALIYDAEEVYGQER